MLKYIVYSPALQDVGEGDELGWALANLSNLVALDLPEAGDFMPMPLPTLLRLQVRCSQLRLQVWCRQPRLQCKAQPTEATLVDNALGQQWLRAQELLEKPGNANISC